MIELTAFLGNPGREYAHTRHNTGRMLAERLPFFPFLHWRNTYKGLYASITGNRLLSYDGGNGTDPSENLIPATIHFLMPETYMNRSGESISRAASFFKIPPDRILLVHDELELSLGQAALKFSGGLGGHNGLRSMRACFNTPDFWRMRIGIGRPNHDDISGWVLSDFTPDERSWMEQALNACADALLRALIQGPQSLLPEWNKKKIIDAGEKP